MVPACKNALELIRASVSCTTATRCWLTTFDRPCGSEPEGGPRLSKTRSEESHRRLYRLGDGAVDGGHARRVEKPPPATARVAEQTDDFFRPKERLRI